VVGRAAIAVHAASRRVVQLGSRNAVV
jgi:hypothetical protein